MKALAKKMRVLLVTGVLALACAAIPLVSQVLGGGAELTASAASDEGAYQIENITQNKTLTVTDKNIGRGADFLVYYDSVWAATHDGGTAQNIYGIEVKVELKNDKYVVTEVSSAGNMQIPANGFVLSGNGSGKEALTGFKVGDELEFIDNSDFIAYNKTTGYEVYISAKNKTSENCATVWTSAHGAATPARAWWYNIVCEKTEGENLYKVIDKNDRNSADSSSLAIPEGGIVFDMNGYLYNTTYQYTYLYYFWNNTKIDDIIYFEDKNAVSLNPADITVTSGSHTWEVDGSNPTPDQKFNGKSLIYTNTANGYTTLARTGETVKEYIVEKKGDDWEVTDVKSESQTIIPDYNGFVLSIPSAISGYDSLKKGDKVTLKGSLEQETAFAVNVTKNKRVFLDGANVNRDENMLVIYDDLTYLCPLEQQGVDLETGKTGTNQNGIEIQVVKENNKYIVKKVTILGEAANLQIPEDGFVLSGHGAGATALSGFEEGDEIHVYDKAILSNTKLTSIKINGERLDTFDPDRTKYAMNVEEGAKAPVVTCSVQTRMGQKPDVKVNGIETAMGTVTIEVTALDGSTATYTLTFDRERSKDARLASITIDGVELENITNNMTVTVKKGAIPTTVAATAMDSKATITVTQATAENKTAVIKVEAEAPGFSREYKITFVEADTSLASITIGDNTLEGFSADTLSYTYKLGKGTTEAPTVSATATDSKTTVTVEQAESVTGTAKITVTLDGVSTTYTVQFEVEAGGGSNVGMIIGIVAGVVAVLVAAGVAVVIVMKKRGKNKQ